MSNDLREHLRALEREGGKLLAADVVEAARPEDSPLLNRCPEQVDILRQWARTEDAERIERRAYTTIGDLRGRKKMIRRLLPS